MATKANVSMIEGDQGGGKTNTAVAIIVDTYKKKKGGIKVFTNFNLYGIRHVKCSIADIIRYINNGLMRNAILVIDETYIEGDARRGMSELVLMFTWFAMQMRKREIEAYVIVQDGRMLDWRWKFVIKRRYMCKYNEKTRRISVMSKNVDTGHTRQFSYYAPQYWRYFDTNELPEIPEKMIEKVLKKV